MCRWSPVSRVVTLAFLLMLIGPVDSLAQTAEPCLQRFLGKRFRLSLDIRTTGAAPLSTSGQSNPRYEYDEVFAATVIYSALGGSSGTVQGITTLSESASTRLTLDHRSYDFAGRQSGRISGTAVGDYVMSAATPLSGVFIMFGEAAPQSHACTYSFNVPNMVGPGITQLPSGTMHATYYSPTINGLWHRFAPIPIPATGASLSGSRQLAGALPGQTAFISWTIVLEDEPRVTNLVSPPRQLLAQVSGPDVQLAWQESPGADAYVIEVGSAPGLANLMSSNLGNTTTLRAVGSPGRFFVRVRARLGPDLSPPSNEVVIDIGPAVSHCAALAAPSTLQATSGSAQLIFTWGAVSGATSYRLQAGTAPGLANVFDGDVGPISSLSIDARGVAPGVYFVRVAASNACGTSTFSNDVAVQLPVR